MNHIGHAGGRTASPSTTRRLAPYAIVLLAFGLLMFQLDAKSLSGDEFGNVQIESGTLGEVFQHMANAWSQHPPISHLILFAWIKTGGTSDFMVRFPAVAWTVVSVCLTYHLARKWFERGLALTAALLLALAPNLMLYGRMEKYYSLVMALALFMLWLFDQTVRRPWPALFAAQGLASLIVLYADYFAALFVVGTINILAILIWRRERTHVIGWLLPQIAAFLLFLPFATIVSAQMQSIANSPAADLASGWVAVAGKLAFFPYALSVGETIFPWWPTALIGVLAFSVVALIGLIAMWQVARPQASTSPATWIVAVLLASIIGSILLTSTVLVSVPLITLPNHVHYILPLYTMLVATGLHRTGSWRVPLAGLLIVLVIPSHINYYTHRQFFNPVFVTPSREVLAYIHTRSQPGDLLVEDVASGVSYYYEQDKLSEPILLKALGEVQDHLVLDWHRRVWLVTVGRDRTRFVEPDPIAAWLEQNLQLVETWGFGEQDATYRVVKERLTGRPAYAYRVVVQLYAEP